mmetsp:Transcript_60813/g.162780  ORF Transcript_60813/g.162780 Transcript_60813/m.162780 type:complete len:366 (-) Transcript_60813:40-1137(-)|eukprot:CAMPEP_0171189118 /NCGR_PEP_ID=MMETSP0790-20130122/18181_1 /TAXON_ID=2925 /ORGANISM="Alexandrium catenella, Strain OF101" /LENGTH=365 /DNA_ID=CAMNT_0011654219 /DNA_START=76 /DNA_END=1173 /DNA_ORIENTATION=-
MAPVCRNGPLRAALLLTLTAGFADALRTIKEDGLSVSADKPSYQVGGENMCVRDVRRKDGQCKFISQTLCSGMRNKLFNADELHGNIRSCFTKKRSCALIGSSQLLLNTTFGRRIDSDYEVVIRLNNAPTGRDDPKLDAHVGSRTDVRFMNHLADPMESERKQGVCVFLQEPDVQSCGKECSMNPRRCDPECVLGANLTCRSLQLASNLRRTVDPNWGSNKVILDHVHSGIAQGLMGTSPTLGLKAFAWAMHTCETVDLYGMGPSCKGKVGAKYYDHEGAIRLDRSLYSNEFDWFSQAARKLDGDFAASVPKQVQGWATAQKVKMYLPKCVKVKARARLSLNPNFEIQDLQAEDSLGEDNFDVVE